MARHSVANVTRTHAFDFSAPLWRYPGEGGWHFVTVPPEMGVAIADVSAGIRRGFGSLRVAARVGETSWRTSIFPDSKAESYLLPVKKAVRTAERLEDGDVVRAHIELIGL